MIDSFQFLYALKEKNLNNFIFAFQLHLFTFPIEICCQYTAQPFLYTARPFLYLTIPFPIHCNGNCSKIGLLAKPYKKIFLTNILAKSEYNFQSIKDLYLPMPLSSEEGWGEV